jgi:putative endonuclease
MRTGLEKRALGQRSEDLAERFLRARGYVIVARNYRCTYGELDLVAEDRETVVFVEVRSQSSPLFGEAVESVTLRKQRQIVKAASHYVLRYGVENRPLRFDVVGIRWVDGTPQLTHIPGAFELPSGRGRGGYVRY